ncbi:MAG: type IX secretion system outer membrane channel protein PorV [Lutibacter sp.]|uniref:type IX secretion system outer membrane channel protein PorV n=1 Tax=Lutibacter sp. TaxID=1925666 RepID=UPI0017BEB665|nr:type IX secretion system outer membrane channel protein PorV [Lutibacter sp.]MBT8316576.1 type IX secretion system outer membrane channel protein PorV [Lutibacter sp.]NNJ57436.1 type IX secretion system outer membrane channel protein PorV [Lutibacter sp.]
MRKGIILALAISLIFTKFYSQEAQNTITTAAPFLLIAPDARAGGMGDIGVATSPDANSQHWNASKFAFMPSQFSVGIVYTPWLRELTNDVFLGGFSFANRIDDRSAWATSLKYFNLGQIDLTDINGAPEGTEKLNEFSLDASYSLKLSETYAMGVTMRYIRSDLGIESANSTIQPVNTFAVDISGYFQSDEKNYGNFNGMWRGGYNISNIGPKVSYTDDGLENFIPTNLKIGGGFDFILDTFNKVSVNLEFNKLLVPTPSISVNDDGEAPYVQDDVGFVSGMFSSFGDAPGGFSEELKEFTWALGAEYMYDHSFAIRAGYFNESDLKGARKYFTLGSGFKFKSTRLDISYLFNASNINNPLENTLRFSLAFDFGELFEIH